MSDTEEETMTTKQAADYLGVSLMTVKRRIDSGELNPITEKNSVLKRPRRILLSRAEVERLKSGPPRKD